ncbi:MAG: hypothetical protein V3U53_02120 [bacterium]
MRKPVENALKTARELWAGEVPLKFVFWVYAFAGVVGFKWVMRTVEKYGYSEDPVYLALAALAVLYSAFAAVAVWKSASNFTGGKAWAYAARAAAILWPFSIFWGP